MLVFKLFCF